MANARTGNVIFVDADNTAVTEALSIKSIKYIGAASGTATIKLGGTSGSVIWEESGSANVWNPNVEIYAREGIYVDLTNSAKIYIYLK
jgi:hypothetical protein